ncbi:hypothetical protein [Tissierella praeacuta]|uniref:hypothetical protein n=1 Tax=Tissierella praeacuta TaxID=43131 RepID=UPI00334202EC
MKRYFILLIILNIIMVSGCEKIQAIIQGGDSKKNVIEKPYLSITRTYMDETESMFSEYFIYDIKDKKIEKIAETPYNSQHPIGIVDLYDNKLYYSNKTGSGDQLFSYDIKTKKITQLTNNLWAINYIIPTKDHIHLVAARLIEQDVEGESRPDIQAMYIDKSTNIMGYYRKYDHHTKAQHISYNPWNQKIYITFLNNNENHMSRAYEAGKNPKDSTMYSPAEHIVKEFDPGLKNERDIFNICDKAMFTFSRSKDIALISTSKYYTVGDIKYEFVNLNTKTVDETNLKVTPKGITYSCLDPYGNKMYFIGLDSEGLKNVYCYDMDNDFINIILGPHEKYESAINNITMVGR